MPGALTDDPSKWRSEHIWRMPDAVEPTLIISILLIAMFTTRRKNYSISAGCQTQPRRFEYSRVESPSRYTLIDSNPPEEPTDACATPPISRPPPPETTPLIHSNAMPLDLKPSYKYRRILGVWLVRTPDSSRFAKNIHSRVLVKFPFLVEMSYWAISFYLYRLTGIMAQKKYGGTSGLWDIAQGHGIGILEFESQLFGLSNKTGNARWAEYKIQQWYLTGADGGDFRGLWLTILDRGYSLIHIPGTVGFIAFYYWYAPNFKRFAIVRRTMTLLNFGAFLIFLLYPTMPPRFLPSEYGFIDTVNAEDAQSVWMSGQYVNKLAAMPSMHFGYAFTIGCVFIYESDFLQLIFSRTRWSFLFDNEENESGVRSDGRHDEGRLRSLSPPVELKISGQRKSALSRVLFLSFGVFYPLWILLTIVATANHYFLDALVAMICTLIAFLCNRLLLNFYPLEDWLLWALRVEKPPPTTGWLRRKVSSPL